MAGAREGDVAAVRQEEERAGVEDGWRVRRGGRKVGRCVSSSSFRTRQDYW